MNNHITRVIVFACIAILVALVELIVFPITALVLFSFGTIVLSIVITAVSLLKIVKDDKKNLIVNAAMPFVLDGYLFWTIFFALLFVLLEYFCIFSGFAATVIFLILQLLAAVVASWKVFLVSAGQEEIIRQDEKIAIQTSFWKQLTAEAHALPGKTPVEAKKNVQRVVEAIRYADPRSVPGVAVLEEEIRENLIALGKLVDEKKIDEITVLCNTLELQVKDRAGQLKNLK